MKKYVCVICGYVYDPAVGDPDSGIEPGTAFEDLAMDIGQKASRAVYYAEILVPFIWTAACTAVGIFPVWCLLVLPAAVPAALNLKAMKGSRTEGPGAIGSLDEMTAKLQMTFSLLFTISFVLAYFL